MVILYMGDWHIQNNHYITTKTDSQTVMTPHTMIPRPLGNTGLFVSPIGFGAFKIGRNQGIKYARPYDLPDLPQVQLLVNQLIENNVTYFDTAPAYGLSEERLGQTLPADRTHITLSTKIGERFTAGQSTYDFTQKGVGQSIQNSLKLLRTDCLDIVFIHSNGQDMDILENSDAPATLDKLKAKGVIRAIGFSGKTVQGAQAALPWADVLMVEYHLEDRSHENVMQQAKEQGKGVVVKKGLASGRLPASDAIAFVLSNPAVSSLIIGGLNITHMQSNIAVATRTGLK